MNPSFKSLLALAFLLILPVSLSAQSSPVQSPPAEQPPASPPAVEPVPGDLVTLTLDTGEILKGVLTASDDAFYTLEHPLLGRLTLPRERIAATALGDAPHPADAPTSTVPAPSGSTTPEPERPSNAQLSFLKGWTGSVEFGLNGSDGNTERLSGRAGFGAKRNTKETETSLSFVYSYATESGDTTENKARFDARNDWLIANSKWRFFALGSVEYDDFQDWDFRTAVFGGVGYELIKTDRTFLLGRAGVGLSREFGGEDNTIRPEALLGLDFEHKFTDRQKFVASADVYPDLADLGEYRAVAKAAYEILVDPENNLTFKVGVEDRYDSTPGEGFKRNDIDYFALLVWSF